MARPIQGPCAKRTAQIGSQTSGTTGGAPDALAMCGGSATRHGLTSGLKVRQASRYLVRQTV